MAPKLALFFALWFQSLEAARFHQKAVSSETAVCGPGVGSCEMGSCCSEMGFCGTTAEYCAGPQCQIDYSHSCDTMVPPGGSDTSGIPRPRVGDVPYGGPMITSCKQPGMVALSFDDGPYIYTKDLLDLLDDFNIRATFFIAGANNDKGHIDDPSTGWPSILHRMYDTGHQIASHTWTHRDLNQANATIQRTEIIYNEMAIRNVFGWVPTYIRPPYLECSASSNCEKIMADLAYHSISVNLDTKDYMYDEPALIQMAKDRYSSGLSPDPSQNSYIVLAHDIHEQTVHNLTNFMVNLARERGYKFVTVGECLGDPKENWYRPAGGSSKMARAVSKGASCSGSTPDSCGTECDNDSGDCDPSPQGISDTTNGLCGARHAATCLNFAGETCCSEHGYCGNKTEHCGKGCQEKYGHCD